jgi:hypothetical protein
MSIIVAKKYQPSIMIIDEFETVFPVKKKGKDLTPSFGTKLKKGLLEMKKNRYW